MKNIFKAEMDSTIELFVRVFVALPTFSIAIKVLMILQLIPGEMEDPAFHLIFPILFLLYSCYLHNIKERSHLLKQISLYMGTEIIVFFIRIVSYSRNEQKTLFIFFATGAVINFQTRIVNSYYAIILISFKHYFQWNIYDAIQENIPFHPFDIISMFGYICMMLIQSKNRRDYISQIQEYSHSLCQSNKNLQMLTETLQTGLVMINKDFSLQNLNLKAKTLLGCNESNFMSTLRGLMYRGEETCSVYDSILRNREIGMNTNIALGSIYRESKHISFNLSKIQWSESFIYVLLVTDATDTVKLENSKLENELKTKFLKFIPHELQTPTVGILGCAEGSLEAVKDNNNMASINRNLEMIYNSARRLHLMICNIADYTEIICGRFELRKNEIDVTDTIQDAYEILFKQAKAQNLTTTLRIDPRIPRKIKTDSQRLLQMLTILLFNSLKYTYTGFIEIVAVLDSNSNIRIEVNDSGIGITSEMLLAIHEQLQNPQPGNLFFGLEVCDNIARKLGKSPLKINSNGGTNVAFDIICMETERALPVSDESSDSIDSYEGQNRNEVPEFRLSRDFCQVLIVDDYDSSRAVLARILEKEKLSYLEARDGQQAVQIVRDCDQRRKPLELVIMDIDMPVMNGWDATAAIFELVQKGEISRKPFIIAYSAYTDPEFIEKASHLGMISYIKKPARAKDISRIVKSLVKGDN